MKSRMIAMTEKLEYTLKAAVAGGALGAALTGGISFIPMVSVTELFILTAALTGSIGLALYTFFHA